MATAGVISLVFVGYILLVVVIIRTSVRRARRKAEERNDALREGLKAAGARRVEDRPVEGLYDTAESEYELGDRRVFVSTRYVSRSWMRLNVRLSAGAVPHCFVTPEGGLNRFGKLIGVNKEVQTGDTVFDDAAYLDSYDEERFVKELFAVPEVRLATRELLTQGYEVEFSQRGVEAFRVVSYYSDTQTGNVGPVVESLSRIARALPSFRVEELRPIESTPKLFAVVLIALMLVIAPAFALGTLSQGASAPHVSWLVYVGFGGAAWAAFTIGLTLWLRGSSHAFTRVVWLSGLTLFSIPALTGNVLFLANETFDRSPGVTRSGTVTRISHSRDTHWFVLRSEDGPENGEKIGASCESLSKLKVGDSVSARFHDGALGWQWIERLN